MSPLLCGCQSGLSINGEDQHVVHGVYLRRVLYPTAVPSPMGRRMEAAGLAKTPWGIVRAGM